jgi:diguanylate cyclase (GGDEF)-like protein
MGRGEKFIVRVAPELDIRSAETWIKNINIILKASMIYSLHLEMNSALRVIGDLAADIVRFDQAIFYLFDEDEKHFYPAYIKGFSGSLPPDLHSGNTIMDWAVENRQPVRVEGADTRELYDLSTQTGCNSVLCLPVQTGNRVVAAFQFFSAETNIFSDEIIRLLWILTLQLEGLFHQLDRQPFSQAVDLDPFTSLPSRSQFEQDLEREFIRSRRSKRPFNLVLVGIDNYHKLKGQIAALGGSILARDVSTVIGQMVRKIDQVARYSESTFALILPETELRKGQALADRIRMKIASGGFTGAAGMADMQLTVSVGMSSYPECLTVPQLLEEAAGNLKEAREAGGNKVISGADLPGSDTKPVAIDLQNLLDTVGNFFQMEDLLSQMVEFFSRLSDADRVSILVLDESETRLLFKHGVGFQGFESELKSTVMDVENSICGQAVKNRQPLVVEDIESIIPTRKRRGLKYSSPSFMSIPLIYKDRVTGVINFSNRNDRKPFTHVDLTEIMPHAPVLAKLLTEGRNFASVQKDFFIETADILLNISESKSPYLKGHSDRVTDLTYKLAGRLGIADEEAQKLANAARYHDIGRIAVDEGILSKTGPLDDSERSLVRQHPLWSARILETIPGLNADLDAVRSHHERFDGKGYPGGLLGEEIPIGGRVIAVTDAYDAMVHERPFRQSMTHEDALKVLESKSWSQFDGRVVNAFKGLEI